MTSAAFASDLSELMANVDLWLHGHVHDSFDYQVGCCRVVANPCGYPRNRFSVTSARELEFENPHFQFASVIDTSKQLFAYGPGRSPPT